MEKQATTRDQIERALSDLPCMIHRDQLAKLLGLANRTLANKDSVGEGPSNPLHIGRRVLYEKTEVINWLVSRATQGGN